MDTIELYRISGENARLKTLEAVLEERADHERELVSRHPMVPVFCNWCIVFAMIALVISFIIWGVTVAIQNKADQQTAEAMAARDAEEQAAAEAERVRLEELAASEEAVIQREAEDCAKALYGIVKFIEKYGYDYNDCVTYLRAAFNRADATGTSLHDVLFAKDQFLACREDNPVLAELLDISIDAVTEWNNEKTKPVDISYQFAELTENGIYLKNDFNANGYAIRWRAK